MHRVFPPSCLHACLRVTSLELWQLHKAPVPAHHLALTKFMMPTFSSSSISKFARPMLRIRGSLCNYWHPPPLPERKRKVYSSTWDSIISKDFTVGVESFFRPFQPRLDERKNSSFGRNLNVALPPWSTALRVKTAIPCVLSLSFENRGE